MHNSPSCTLYVTRKYRLAHVDMVLPFIYSWPSEERLLTIDGPWTWCSSPEAER